MIKKYVPFHPGQVCLKAVYYVLNVFLSDHHMYIIENVEGHKWDMFCTIRSCFFSSREVVLFTLLILQCFCLLPCFYTKVEIFRRLLSHNVTNSLFFFFFTLDRKINHKKHFGHCLTVISIESSMTCAGKESFFTWQSVNNTVLDITWF